MHFFLVISVIGQLAGYIGPVSEAECNSILHKTEISEAYRQQVTLKCYYRSSPPVAVSEHNSKK